MKKILLLLCCFVAAGFCQLDCSFSENCNGQAGNMYEITCNKDAGGGGPECSCTDGSATCPEAAVIGALTYDTFDAAACESQCTGDCVFYKWTKDLGWFGGAKHCFNMKEDECDGLDSHPCDDPEHCVSGSVGDKCDGTNTKPPPPIENACSFIDNFEYDKSGESLHWLCGDIDAYDGVTTSVPTGTICTAHHSCSDYVDDENNPTDYTLVYECKITGDGEGTWVSFRNDDDKYLDDVTVEVDEGGENRTTATVRKLKEPACATAPLNISADNYNQPGLLISCTDDPITVDEDDDTIFQATAPNTCLLLCDYYPILSFYPGWTPGDDTGLRTWLYSMEDGITDPDDSTDVLDPTIIKCWD